MSKPEIGFVYGNSTNDRIAITIGMFADVGWTKEQVMRRINQWLTAMRLTGHWWEQTEEWQARLHEAMRATWEAEYKGCADF
jgi:hypothetical protein